MPSNKLIYSIVLTIGCYAQKVPAILRWLLCPTVEWPVGFVVKSWTCSLGTQPEVDAHSAVMDINHLWSSKILRTINHRWSPKRLRL